VFPFSRRGGQVSGGGPDWEGQEPPDLMSMYDQMAQSGPQGYDSTGYRDRIGPVVGAVGDVISRAASSPTGQAFLGAMDTFEQSYMRQPAFIGSLVRGAVTGNMDDFRRLAETGRYEPGDVTGNQWLDMGISALSDPSSIIPGPGPAELKMLKGLAEGAAVFAGGRTLSGAVARGAGEAVELGAPRHTIRTLADEDTYRLRQSEKPEGARIFSDPVPYAVELAETYKAAAPNLGYDPSTYRPGIITSLDVDHQKRIGDAFEAAPHAPYDPEVRAAYDAMARETLDQYEHIVNNGVVFEIWDRGGEPYPNSAAMLRDVRENKHMYVLATESEFGMSGLTDEVRAENPLMAPSGFTDVNGRPMLINDVFRGVHDFFGHSVRGNSFGAIGEENAWAEHALMYTPLARRAMTTETRGQNSWVNFGPNMRAPDGSILKPGDPGYLSARDRPFADQKVTLLPEWASNALLGEAVETFPGETLSAAGPATFRPAAPQLEERMLTDEQLLAPYSQARMDQNRRSGLDVYGATGDYVSPDDLIRQQQALSSYLQQNGVALQKKLNSGSVDEYSLFALLRQVAPDLITETEDALDITMNFTPPRGNRRQ